MLKIKVIFEEVFVFYLEFMSGKFEINVMVLMIM